MSEIIRSWFKDLYGEAIKNAKSTIANERLWLNGACVEGDDDATFNHERNIEINEEYIEELENLIEELD